MYVAPPNSRLLSDAFAALRAVFSAPNPGRAFWLDYYSGSIKAAFVIACVLGVALVGLAGLSLVPGLLIATSCSVGIVGLLAMVQRRINAKNLHPIRVVSHPQLGQVSVYRNSWQTQLQPFALPYSCTLSGVGEADVPTQEGCGNECTRSPDWSARHSIHP